MQTTCTLTTVANSIDVTIKAGFTGTLSLPAWVKLAGDNTYREVRGVTGNVLSIYPAPTAGGDVGATLFSDFTPRCALPLLQSIKDDDYYHELAYKLEALLSTGIPNAKPVFKDIPTPMYSEGAFAWYTSLGKLQIIGQNTKWLQLQDKLPNILFKRAGDTFVYEVASIESDTQLTLKQPYLYEGDIPFDMYHPDMYYQEHSVLFFGGALWRNSVQQTVGVEPPAPFFDLTKAYNQGMVVFDAWSRKFYRNISGGPLVGVPLTSTQWELVGPEAVRSSEWTFDNSEEYQLCYNLTPNLKLPLVSAQDTDKVSWARYIFAKAFAAL